MYSWSDMYVQYLMFTLEWSFFKDRRLAFDMVMQAYYVI